MFFPTYFPINFFHSSSWYQITKSSIFYYECVSNGQCFFFSPLQIDIFMHWSILGTIWCFSFCSFHFTFSYFIDLVVCEYIVVQFSHSFNWNVVSFHHILLFFWVIQSKRATRDGKRFSRIELFCPNPTNNNDNDDDNDDDDNVWNSHFPIVRM